MGSEIEIKEGAVVSYEQQGQLLLAVVTQLKAGKLSLTNEKGSALELPAARLYPLPTPLPKDTTDKAAYLVTLHAEAEEIANDLPLEDLWTFTVEEDKEQSISDLCELYFGNNSQKEHLAMRIALLNDNIFFKRKKDNFSPRPAAVVEELKHAEESRKNKQDRQKQTLEFFVNALQNPSGDYPDNVRNDIYLLEELAASTNGMESGRLNDARQLLSQALEFLKIEIPGTKEEQAFELLKKLGVFNTNTNLSLIRNHIRTEFPKAVLEAANSISLPDEFSDASIRKDLRSVYTVTIDDESTEDMDDAISIEKTATGYTLGVHISDVASLISEDSPLDNEASLRTTSLYFPTGPIPMLPPDLAHQVCSLRADRDRPCMSCLFTLDEMFNVVSTEVTPSIIKVDRKCSYDEVDLLLENGDEFFNMIYQATATAEMKRFEEGGFKIHKKEMYVVINEDGSLGLKEFDEDDTARNMVGETAIMANYAMATFAKNHALPVLYRNQPAPDEDQLEGALPPEGLARDYAERCKLKPSSISFIPEGHHTLGLPAYIQATSPIRRYTDLCNQRQLLSYFRNGAPLYSEERYQEIFDLTENARSSAFTVTKESKRFWFLRYLQERMKSDPFIEATVLRSDRKLPLIELHEIFMPTIPKIKGEFNAGDVLKLKITRVNPQFDELRLELVDN